MAKDINIKITLDGQGNLKKVSDGARKASKETDKLNNSTRKYNKTQEEQYTRQKQGVIQTANTTKNFSKLQQATDGGGAGGLVRAYALLAANVFALTAAFGVLSRSAQIDTLNESMEILSKTGGVFIRNLAKDMQEASGFAIDLAQSFTQVSLASSAGLSTKEIEGLTMVAKGAAISLGRNLPDAMDRIFRGAIKLEPEILDEIGLFVRVDEAAQKFARNNGKVVSALTQVEKRQAFLNEILEQGTRKFQEYAEEVKPDPYVRLGAALGDIAQEGLSVVNSVLGPLLEFLSESKLLLQAVFGALVFVLLKKAVPALGIMTKNTAELAAERAQAAKDYTDSLTETTTKAAKEEQKQLRDKRDSLKKQQQLEKRFVSRSKAPGASTTALDKAKLGTAKRAEKVQERILVLEKAQKKAKGENATLIKNELDMLREEEKIEQRLLTLKKNKNRAVKEGSLADLRQRKLDSQARVSGAVAGLAGTMETQGIREGFKEMTDILDEQVEVKGKLVDKYSASEKRQIKLKASTSALGIGFNKLMMVLGPIMMIFTMLSPLIIAIGKAMGFASEEAKKMDESIKQMNDQLENMNKRQAAQLKGMKSTELTFIETTKANTAFYKGIEDTTSRILDNIEAFKEYEKSLKTIPRRFQAILEAFGGGRSNKVLEQTSEALANSIIGLMEAGKEEIVKDLFPAESVDNILNYVNQLNRYKEIQEGLNPTIARNIAAFSTTFGVEFDELTKSQISRLPEWIATLDPLEKEYFDLTVTMKNTRDEMGFQGESMEVLQQKINQVNSFTDDLAKKYENLGSALAGANEAVGKFQSQFLPKTKVDDIIGSMDAIDAAIDAFGKKTEMSNEEYQAFLTSIRDGDNVFSGLFRTTSEEVETIVTQLEDGSRVTMEFLKKDAWEAVKDILKDFQISTLALAMQTKRLTAENKNLNEALNGGAKIRNKINENTNQILANNSEIARKTLQVTGRSFGIEEKKVREITEQLVAEAKLLNTKEEHTAFEKKLQKFGLTKIELLQLQATLDATRTEEIKEQVHLQTKTERLKIQELNTQKELNSALREANNATQSLAVSQAKVESLRARGTTELTPAKQAEIEISAATTKFQIALREAKLKQAMIDAESQLLVKRLFVLAKETGDTTMLNADQTDLEAGLKANLTEAASILKGAYNDILSNIKNELTIELSQAVANAFSKGVPEGILAARSATLAGIEALDKAQGVEEGDKLTPEQKKERQDLAAGMQMQSLRDSLTGMSEELKKLGPEGELVALVAQGALVISDAWSNVGDVFSRTGEKAANSMERGAAVAQAVAATLTAIGQIMQQNSQVQISEMDKQIQAEKNRDGKSKESLAKIKAMEAKKEAMKKKAFEQNKKMQMAVTVANTAAAIMGVWAGVKDPFFSPGIAAAQTAVIAALGAAQLAIIAKTSYQGGASSVDKPQIQKVSIGKRDDKVDVSRGASRGELAYLRGQRGYGMGSGNFTPTGGAYGKKGYFTGGEGILVGEQGPEIVKPASPRVDVIPNDELNTGAQNINFTINAVDAAGVEQLLTEQRGNIIGMIREAANDTGEYFLEDVDIQAMGGSGGGYGG